jgi:hypothetical protein
VEAVADFLDRFGTLLLAVYFALYFLATALMCYALQALSDKTEAAPSWMAWVPILQIHPFVRATGTSYTALLGWLGAGIGLAVAGGLASQGGSAPGLFVLLVLVYVVAALVWFAGLFWRLAVRRGLSGLVGLACFIPLLGLFFYLYLALHDGLVRPSGVGLAITALLSLLAVASLQRDLGEARALLRGEMPPGAGADAAAQAEAAALFQQLAGARAAPGAAPRAEAGSEGGAGLLDRLRAWVPAAPARGRPEAVAIPDAVVCEPGTRIAGARPPRGDAMWCERPDGLRHGWYLAWYPDGGLEEAGRYADGRRQGVWTRFWDSGGRRAQVHFEDDREDGILVLWDELGRTEREIRYVRGEPAPLDAAR